MKITTKGRYGVRAVINLATSYYTRPISIHVIAEEEGVSSEFLEQIFFKLKKAGIIRSIRGPGGGFVINKNAADITIKDILDAVGETSALSPCADVKKSCERSRNCPAKYIWLELSSIIDQYLSGITIKEIVDKSGKSSYVELGSAHDFSI